MSFPERKEMRLKNYDYSFNGAYFITIRIENGAQILSKIRRGGVLLLPIGELCNMQILELQTRYHIVIDKYVIMPNHIHMIILINRKRVGLDSREEQSPSPTVSDIVCAFISITTKIANKQDGCAGRKIWQRSFYDHIIRNKYDYENIWDYIDTNPLRWEQKCFT